MALKDNCVYLNVQVDKDLKRRVRSWGIANDITLTQIVSDVLEEFVDAKEKAEDYERGLKVINEKKRE